MSPPATATTSDSKNRRRCDRDACSAIYLAGAGHAGYCSDTCWAQHEADRLIDIVQGDHKFCASCFRRLRNVVPPGRAANSNDKHKEIPECAIGFAYPTPETMTVTGELFRLEQTREGPTVLPSDQATRRRGCECGTTHHATVERGALSTQAAIDHAQRLLDALEALREDAVHERDFDRDTALDAVRVRKSRPDQQAASERPTFRIGLAAGLLANHRA